MTATLLSFRVEAVLRRGVNCSQVHLPPHPDPPLPRVAHTDFAEAPGEPKSAGMGVAYIAELGAISTPPLLLNHLPLLDNGRGVDPSFIVPDDVIWHGISHAQHPVLLLAMQWQRTDAAASIAITTKGRIKVVFGGTSMR